MTEDDDEEQKGGLYYNQLDHFIHFWILINFKTDRA